MAGYSGYSKSNNALAAEEDGRWPMTVARKIVAKKTGLKVAEAQQLLEKLHTGEYHHTSKRYNATRYYDTVHAIEYHRLTTFAAALPDDWTARMNEPRKAVENDTRTFAERRAEIGAVDAALAAEFGVDAETLVDAFYELAR